MAEVLVIGKKISEMGLVNEITGEEKIPTGVVGDKAVTTGQLLTYLENNGKVQWGRIEGDITNQDDLQNQFTQQLATLQNHIQDQGNPHNVTKEQVGLGNVDNTADLDKPISNSVKSELKSLHEKGAALPYEEGVAYEEGAVVVKDGELQQWRGGVWRSVVAASLSDTIQTFNTPEAGVDPVTGVANDAYFNVRSPSDYSYLEEYQNVGGSAVATGRSYSSSRVVVVDSIADLLALPAGQRKEGLRYLVKGYHTGSGTGGGEFFWDASRTSENDGGLVLDGFVRKDVDKIYIEFYGATEGNIPLTTDALQKACTSPLAQAGVEVHMMSGRNYSVSEGVRCQNLIFRGNGSNITLTENYPYVFSVGGMESGVVTSLSEDVLAGAYSVLVDDVTGVKVGDIISIVSNATLHASRYNVYKAGVTAEVTNVSGNRVSISRAPSMLLPALNSRVVIFPSAKVDIQNLSMNGFGSTVQSGSSGLIVTGALRPIVNDTDTDLFENHIVFRHCVGGVSDRVNTRRAYYTGTPTSYGMVVYSCTGMDIGGLRTFTGRHGFATGSTSVGLPEVDPNDYRGAPVYDIEVSRKSSIYPEVGVASPNAGGNNGFDCHAGAVNVTCRDSVIWRFQVCADYVLFEDVIILGQTNQSSLIGYRSIPNAGEYRFVRCTFNGVNQVELQGYGSIPDFTGEWWIKSITYEDCQTASGVITKINLANGDNSKSHNLGSFNLIRSFNFRAELTSGVQLGDLQIIGGGIGGNSANAFVGAGSSRAGRAYISGGSYTARYGILSLSAFKDVVLRDVEFLVPEGTNTMMITLSDDANIFLENTKLNFSGYAGGSVNIVSQGGGGTLTQVNSPIRLQTGGSTVGFARVSEWPLP